MKTIPGPGSEVAVGVVVADGTVVAVNLKGQKF